MPGPEEPPRHRPISRGSITTCWASAWGCPAVLGTLYRALPPGSHVFIHHMLDSQDPASATLQAAMQKRPARDPWPLETGKAGNTLTALLAMWVHGQVMRILLAGGSGYVGEMVTPLLSRRAAVRIYDLRPAASESEYVRGDATDYAALLAAMTDVDAVVHCAMAAQDGTSPDVAAAAFDVNVKSVHQTLSAAHHARVPHLVYLSSMSVYQDPVTRQLDESTAPDASDVYGLTKRLGEEVCRAAVLEYGISVNILRLAWPTPDRDWPAWGRVRPPAGLRLPDGTAAYATAATDVAAAITAALDYRDGLQTFIVSADELGGRWNTAKTRTLLGWQPEFGATRMP